MKKSSQKAATRQGFIKWLPLIVLSAALMIIIIDTTVLNVSIRNIINDLDTNVQNIQWVISAYSLTLAALTVTGGRLGDLFGRKRMFILGAILFAIGSIITSFAPTIAWMIFGNAIIEGIGAALMMPATSALLVNNYRGKDRALAFAIWGAVAASAAAIGPILGGYLTAHYSWRWAFRINLVVVALLLYGSKYVVEAREKAKKIELDGIGILLSSVGLVSVVYGFIESSTYGWGKSNVPFAIFGHSATPFGISIALITIVLGLLLLLLFVFFEYKHEANGHIPLVSIGLFKNKQFTAGTFTTALLALGQTGLIFSIPIFYQSVLKLDAFHTGLGLVPLSIAIMIGAPASLKLTRWLFPKRIIQLGFIISTIGAVMTYFALGISATVWTLAPGLFVYGLGLGFGFSQLGNLTLSAVSVKQSGEASGVNNTVRQVGASFGSAIIGAALIATLTSGVVTKIESSQVIPAQAKPKILGAVKAAGSNIEFESPTSKDNTSASIKQEITRSIHEATVDGSKVALLFTAGFSVLALAFSQLLPSIKDLETAVEAEL